MAAGLALVDVVGAALKRPSRCSFASASGTGLVVVGDLTTSPAKGKSAAVVGETPNRARLAGKLLPRPNAVVIGPQQRDACSAISSSVAILAPSRVKGFPEPVHAYQVVGESAIESRFEALHGGRRSRRSWGVRRKSTCCSVNGICAKSGEGRVVLLSGRAGHRKVPSHRRSCRSGSRNEPHTRLRYFCSAHHQDSAFHPIITQLERAAGFEREDTPEGKLDKLATVARPRCLTGGRSVVGGAAVVGDRRPLPASPSSSPSA